MSKYALDSLGTRMKRYEAVSQNSLVRRMPVIIRLDGKAFHTYTRFFKRIDYPDRELYPFNPILKDAMLSTCEALVENIQGCVLAYTQSDEISLLLRDWDTHETQGWFDYNVQKLVSVSASIATAHFNQHIRQLAAVNTPDPIPALALFDSRAYNVPKEDVANYFIWRQNDASRNSVQMLGHHHFSQKQMHGKSNNEVQDMLMANFNINWNDIPGWMKRGSCVKRSTTTDNTLLCDEGIPIFTAQRSYIERHLEVADDTAE